MEHIHFIVNPVAGGNSCLARFRPIERLLEKRGVSFSVVYSEYGGHAIQLAKQAVSAGHRFVVASGGDGTVREVVQELVHTGVRLGILPLGTGNDAVRALGIPSDPLEAAKLLLDCCPIDMDVISANNTVYLNVAGLGFDVDVLEKSRHYKQRFRRGNTAYILGVLHAMLTIRPIKATITTPDETICRDVLMVAVGNGTHIGGGMMVTPLANPHDGLVDLCIVDKVPWYKIIKFFLKFIKGEHLQLDIVHYMQVSELHIDCSPKTKVQLDGEIVQSTPLSIRVLPSALSVLAPCCPLAKAMI